MRSILDVPAGASRRQLKRARDREVQRCRDDMLAQDQRLNTLARKRIDEVDRAFEYLTDPKSFRDFLALVNDKLLLGTMDPNSLAATIARREGLESKAVDSGSPTETGGPTGALRTLAEEREVLKELRRKRLEKAPKIGQKRRQQLDKLLKETQGTIEVSAASTARNKAGELVSRGVTDSDEFYESVYTAALEAAQAARNRALAAMEEKNLPVDEKILDEWELAVLDRSEQAAEREYNNLEGIMASKESSPSSGPRFMVKLAITLCTIAGALCVFCNVNTAVTSNRPDALEQQIKNAGGGRTISGDTSILLKSIPEKVSADKALASAQGLAAPAGSAGAAGAASLLDIDGAADYNAGCQAITSGGYGDATLYFSKAIERNPNIYQYFYNRGLAYLYLGHFQSALADFASAYQLRTDAMQAHYNAGVIYLAGGSRCLTRAEKSKGKDQEVLLKQAALNLRAAVAEFSIVAEKMPKLAQTLYNRGLARYRLGDLEGAAADFDAAGKADSRMAAASYNLARLKSTLKQPASKLVAPGGAIPDAPTGPQGPPAPGLF